MASKRNCDDAIENTTVGDKIVEKANKRATNNGRYNYKRVLGKGGFGHVLMAVDHVRCEVAIKYVKYSVVDKSTAKAEVDILVELKHENIVAIRDYFQICNRYGKTKGMAIVMELCPSGSLHDYLSELKYKECVPLSIENRLCWYKQLASAIQFIHVKKIAHRDLKPANILVADNGKILKVADVGIAKVLGSNDDTFTEQYMQACVGTCLYIAPEVHTNRYTIASDIFSLGLVMYVICEVPVDLNPVVIHREKEYALGRAYYEQLLNAENSTSLLVVEYATEDERKLFDQMLHRNYQERITASDVDNELKSIEDRRERERREQEIRERERREQEIREIEQKRQQQNKICYII